MLGEDKFVYSLKFLPFNMKSINPMQKYLHIIKSYAYILQSFVIKFLFPMIFLICFGIYPTPKLSKYAAFLGFTNNAIQRVLIVSYSLRFYIYAAFFILDKLFLE